MKFRREGGGTEWRRGEGEREKDREKIGDGGKGTIVEHKLDIGDGLIRERKMENGS